MDRRQPGRPRHEPSPATRKTVENLVGAGKSVREIASALGLSAPTLRAYYAEELKAPAPQINFGFSGSAQKGNGRRAAPGAGRPEHVATEATREQVEILVAGGMRHWQIAAALGISEPVLRDRYAAELDAGRSKKTAKVLEAQYRAAVDDGNVSAQKAWLSQHVETDEPPPPPPKEAAIGKKESAMMAAVTAGDGTDWANLLPN